MKYILPWKSKHVKINVHILVATLLLMHGEVGGYYVNHESNVMCHNRNNIELCNVPFFQALRVNYMSPLR